MVHSHRHLRLLLALSVHNKVSRVKALKRPSWSQSPLAKLNDDLKAFSSLPELHTFHTAEHDSIEQESSVDSTFQQDSIATIPASAKGKGKDTAHPLLKNVLRHNLYSANDSSTFESNLKPTSPLKFRGKNKTPVIDKTLNPYLPPGSSSTNWSGVVDLRDSSPLTSQRRRAKNISANTSTATPRKGEADDDSFDGLPPGMSPLVLMSPVRPPRSSAELGLLKLTQTPTREASQRIQRDLVASALKSVHKSGVKGHQLRKEQAVVDSSMSTVPTPPSLSRYARPGGYSPVSSSISKDTSLESMIRHIKDDIRSSASTSAGNIVGVGGTGSTPGLRLRSKKCSSQRKLTPFHSRIPLLPHCTNLTPVTMTRLIQTRTLLILSITQHIHQLLSLWPREAHKYTLTMILLGQIIPATLSKTMIPMLWEKALSPFIHSL
jgi:DASH complex subunit ASK1